MKRVGEPQKEERIWAGSQVGDVAFAVTGEECHLNAEQLAERVRVRDLLLTLIKHRNHELEEKLPERNWAM